MKTPTRIVAGAAIAALLAGGLVVAPASAQSYGERRYERYDDGYRYDPCRRERTQRGTGGALVGAGLGALAGGNIAGSGARTEGAVIGGLLGALVGGNVGASSAACVEGEYREAPRPPRVNYYDDREGYAAYEDDYGYDDEEPVYVAPVRSAGPDECTLAESPIYLPDGTVQKRFVRVCRDASGRYQVVD